MRDLKAVISVNVPAFIVRVACGAAVAATCAATGEAASRTATVTVRASVVHHCAVVNPPNSNGQPGVNCNSAAATSTSGASKAVSNAGSSVHVDVDAKSGVTTINF